MKIRYDFITNSSSSSFIISKKYLDEEQLIAIRKHTELADKLDWDCGWYDKWNIEENHNYITGHTYMDNFSMSSFLEYIGVPDSVIVWDEIEYNLSTYNDNTSNSEINKEVEWRDIIYEV